MTIENKSASNNSNNDSMKSNDSSNNNNSSSSIKNAGVPFLFTGKNVKLAFLLLLTLPLYLMADQEVISTNPMTIGSRKYVSDDESVGDLVAKGGVFSNNNKHLLVSGGIRMDDNDAIDNLVMMHDGNNDAVATAMKEWKDARTKTEAKASEVAMAMERVRTSTDLEMASAMVAAKIAYDEHLMLKHREETLVAKFLATLRGQMTESNGGLPLTGAFSSSSSGDNGDDASNLSTPSTENNATADGIISTSSVSYNNPPTRSLWVATKANVTFGLATVVTKCLRGIGFVTSVIGAFVFFCSSLLSAIAAGYAFYMVAKVWGVPHNSVCATTIQSHVRGWIARRNMKMNHSVMTFIQANVRGWMERRRLERMGVKLRQEWFEEVKAAVKAKEKAKTKAKFDNRMLKAAAKPTKATAKPAAKTDNSILEKFSFC